MRSLSLVEKDILSFFENSPRIDVDFERSKDFGRKVDL